MPLLTRTSFSLLQGASHPEELLARAAELRLPALALTDRDSVAALPQAHAWTVSQAKAHAADPAVPAPPALICGATVTLADHPPVALLAESREGWSHLCRLLTRAHAAAPKGRAVATLQQLQEHAGGVTCLLLDGWTPDLARPLTDAFRDHLEVALSRYALPDDTARTHRAHTLHRALNLPVVAAHDVLFHAPERRRLADVLTCIRRKTTLDRAGLALQANATRYLLPNEELRALYGDVPGAIERIAEVADRCRFRLGELDYKYPREVVPDGWTPMAWLRELVRRSAPERYPDGVPDRVQAQLDHELKVIEKLDFPSYFLTVHDVVAFARRQGILCQGRGSAANSAVCFVLGVTPIDPARSSLLFERFISEERGEPPDIDVDFEHERREEVMQYVYARYGRDRAAMVSEVIAYRPRSAVRDVGKVFGLSLDQCDGLAKLFGRWSVNDPFDDPDGLREAGVDPDSHAVKQTIALTEELVGFPRHLGIHSGGFVIAEGDVVDLCVVEPASMEGRTVIQWDKYGVEALKFVKVDLLALGMLTAIRKAFDLVDKAHGKRWELHTVPAEDPAVYEMFGRADTIGVFQIESRAQQSMLPRLKPRNFYDLVIEVSLVRPGPIQGGMVHPYLRRRSGEEPVTYAHPLLEPILARTLGVPLFQEQVMAIAVAVGGFSAGKADELRRAMGAWRKRGTLAGIGQELVDGMKAKGLDADYCDRILEQVKGFGEYGFPESHAASFAILVYISGWLKHHYPAAFCAALINSQPMGFYAPRTLVGDAQRHGVTVREACVQASDWDCTLERDGDEIVLRLGLRLIRGFGEEAARKVEAARKDGPFRSLPDFQRRCRLDEGSLRQLADAGAFAALKPSRRDAFWTLQGLWDEGLFEGLDRREPDPELPLETPLEKLQADYRSVGLSVGDHPAIAAREALAAQGVHPLTMAELRDREPGTVLTLGLVSSRQRPGTAKGVVFLALEDETGLCNCIVWPKVWEEQKKVLTGHPVLVVQGKLQRQDGAHSVLVERAWPVDEAGRVHAPSRDFR